MLDEEIIYNNGDDYFTALLQSMATAQKSIYLEVYILNFDHIGMEVLEILSAAITRGVVVRVLLDGFGASNWDFNIAESWRKKGLNINFFHPLPRQNKNYALWKNLNLQKISLGFSKFKHRDHRKVCICDSKILFISSSNIVDYHVPRFSGKDAWRDTSAKIQGPKVMTYEKTCDDIWSFPKNYQGLNWLNSIRIQKKIHHREIINQIRTCSKRIWITNPYFVPDIRFLKSLCYAAKCGIDVKILVPYDVRIHFYKYASQAAYSMLCTYGVKIYEYHPTMIHAKILMADNWVRIGSSNLDFRSIYYNLECDVQIENDENISLLEQQFLTDLNQSTQIDLNIWKKRSWVVRLLERFFLLFRNLL